MELLIGASFISAFIAGIAALFAPCCITVLLPAYLGSIFRQRRTVFLMTFVFFLGLLAVFLPLGLGIAGLGQLFSEYHNYIFFAGGIFLLALGSCILMGRHFSLPNPFHRNIKVKGAGSVFGLGVFSGFATLCCAPVLAGVLALSVLPGSIFWGGMYTLAYVLGMVIPLFFIAYFLDKAETGKKLLVLRKRFAYDIGKKRIELTLADMLSGLTFILMGVLILYLASANQLVSHSSYQTSVNILMSQASDSLNAYMGWMPPAAWALLIIAVFVSIVLLAVRRFSRKDEGRDD